MRIDILGCDGSRGIGYRPLCLRLNEHVLIDAGTVAGRLPDEAILSLTDIFFTHCHFDHIADLPFLFETYFGRWPKPLTLHGIEHTLNALKENIFNNVIWPDFAVLPTPEKGQFTTASITPNTTYELADGLKLTPIQVHHTVPTVGYLIEQGDRAVLLSGDTGATDEIWEIANRTPNLKAVLVDCSFAEAETWLADISGHHSTSSVVGELQKLKADCDVYLWHAKVGTAPLLKKETENLQHAGKPVKWLRDFAVLEF